MLRMYFMLMFLTTEAWLNGMHFPLANKVVENKIYNSVKHLDIVACLTFPKKMDSCFSNIIFQLSFLHLYRPQLNVAIVPAYKTNQLDQLEFEELLLIFLLQKHKVNRGAPIKLHPTWLALFEIVSAKIPKHNLYGMVANYSSPWCTIC